jgi:hypothetical protein
MSEAPEYWIEYRDGSKQPFLIFTIFNKNDMIKVIHNFEPTSPFLKYNCIKTSKEIMEARCRKLEIHEVIAFKMLGYI